ncbi:MAG: MurR/RpiR family transcriptional regulator [Clostridia bacterium]|nr:MurR/RpiR family transcriptional regulator [Clostridia bacterium]
MAHADLLGRIRQQYITLSKSHKKIADYILSNYDKVAFMTASSLGKKVNISESTVVRFAGSIGYDGYPELQRELQESIKSKLTTVQRFEMSKGHNESDYLTKIMMGDIDNIRHTIDHVDVDMINTFISKMIGARKVHILGLRSSSILANYLGFYLNFILPDVHVIRETAQDVYDQLLNMTSDDVLIAFSFPRYSKRTYDCVEYAIANLIPILGVTDGLNSPLFDKTEFCLTAKYSMNTFVDSFVAPMSLMNALIIGTSIRKEGVESNLERLERIWEDYGVYNNK